MASDIQNFKCPACTGPLKFSAKTGKLTCEYCDSSYTTEEIEALYAEEQTEAEQAFDINEEKAAKAKENGEDAWTAGEGMKSYNCPSCGAELLCDENTAATCCPYCGNQTVVPGQFSSTRRPDYVIPFKFEKQAAIDALNNHYKGKKLLPTSFTSSNHIEEIQGVYVPFWLYDGTASGTLNYEATTVHETDHVTYTQTETKYYDVTRSGSIKFEKIPADGSSRMPDGHMDSIEPYNYKELKPFSMAYLPGFLAEKYDVDEKACEPRFKERSAETFEARVNATVSNYHSYKNKKKEIDVKTDAVNYALMPVWMLSTKWQDQNFLFAMNGQTGKLVGDLPVDKGKAVLNYIISFILSFIACIVISFFAVDFDGSTVIIDFFAALGIAAIYVWTLVASMKSVGKQDAQAYVTEGGLKLTVKTDVYLRSKIEKHSKSND